MGETLGFQNLGERYWRGNRFGISTSWGGRARWTANMRENWKNGSRKVMHLRSLFRTDATKWFGGDENPAVRCSMDGEFGRLFGRAQVRVSESLETGLGLHGE
jgi:hypothetical protein